MSYVLGQSLWSSALSSVLSQVVDLIPRGWGIKMALVYEQLSFQQGLPTHVPLIQWKGR